MSGSPYLDDNQRLADVVAGIQAMATYKFYRLDFAGWADRITGDKSNAGHWEGVFTQHPEFFRLNSKRDKASLVIRRQHPRRYDVDLGRVITPNELSKHSKPDRISRTPLNSEEISSLVNTAIDLHSRAVAREQLSRWWLPMVIGGLSFVGAVLGALISVYLKTGPG